MRLLIVLITWIGVSLDLHAQELGGPPFNGMMRLTDTATARVSSFDQSGANSDFRPIAAGETLELAQLDGAGIVRHVYFSILGGPHYLRDLVLRAYWDGEETPCVEVPFGDFFGLGQERPRFFSSLMVTVNPGDLGVFGTYGFNSYFPMPYAKGARFTLTNEGPDPVAAVWYHIEYERMSALPAGLGRFHAAWKRENPTQAIGPTVNTTLHGAINNTGKDNYVVLDAAGHGSLVGIFLNIDNATARWYGEGDDMIFIDGEALAAVVSRHGERGDLRRRRLPDGRVRGALHGLSPDRQSRLQRQDLDVPVLRERPGAFPQVDPHDDRAWSCEQFRQ